MATAAWSYSYREVFAAAHAFAGRLRAANITKGQHVVIWSENRPEWIWAQWGCLLEGVVLVPIDYRASADFLLRVASIVEARAIVIGETVGELSTDIPVWRMKDAAAAASAGARRPTP